MKLKFLLPFTFFTLLFLFYPGDSYYFHIFAYNRSLFKEEAKAPQLKINPVPYLKNQYYPDVSAEGVYIVDLPSFTPVFQRNEHEKFLPASTNKIITALVANDLYKLDRVITVKRIITEGQIMNLVQNERITLENLLYGILVHSGNDAAYALADEYGFEQFVGLMNKKAKALGMSKTHFTNPAGLDDYAQYVSPFDLALAARELLKNKF
ncbi:D-alanyl-D-alanine carboxypeptidase, partial [Candidatus Roizmanbacteria bacterium]|nr:D-alanyl-D-alanine carboxypeptidase [Candidatus Roizmanbacteria bacterium]